MYYPIMLKLNGKKVVIVGGGHVAYQKLKSLEGTNAQITIISPTISTEIQEWLKMNEAEWIRKSYESSDIQKADFIFATTNDHQINETIRLDKKEHQFLLQADDAAKGDFILPAVVRRGKLTISVSTSGASPTLARKMKKELSEQYDIGFAEYVQFLDEARQSIIEEVKNSLIKKNCIKRLMEPLFYDLTMEEKWEERKDYLRQVIEEEKAR